MSHFRRTPEVMDTVDAMANEEYGMTLTSALEEGVCVDCKQKVEVGSLRDALSVREYQISGFCQSCQDKVFGRSV